MVKKNPPFSNRSTLMSLIVLGDLGKGGFSEETIKGNDPGLRQPLGKRECKWMETSSRLKMMVTFHLRRMASVAVT